MSHAPEPATADINFDPVIMVEALQYLLACERILSGTDYLLEKHLAKDFLERCFDEERLMPNDSPRQFWVNYIIKQHSEISRDTAFVQTPVGETSPLLKLVKEAGVIALKMFKDRRYSQDELGEIFREYTKIFNQSGRGNWASAKLCSSSIPSQLGQLESEEKGLRCFVCLGVAITWGQPLAYTAINKTLSDRCRWISVALPWNHYSVSGEAS